MLDLLNLVELQYLIDPALAFDEATLGADLADLFTQSVEVDRDILDTGEDVRE